MLTNETVESAPIWFAFRAFLSTSATHRTPQIDRGLTGIDRRTLSVATGDYVAGMPATNENQALQHVYRTICCINCMWKMFFFSNSYCVSLQAAAKLIYGSV